MVDCTWLGLLGFVLILIFFSIALYASLIGIYDAYSVGKRRGWFFLINKEDFCRKNPFIIVICFSVLSLLGGYFFIYKLVFFIIPIRWQCLMG